MDDVDCDAVLKNICDESNVLKLQNGTPIILGRSRETKIKDPRCSRTQLLITLNADDRSVLVEQVGSNPSALNGVQLTRGDKRKANHGDIIEVLESSHFYQVEFTPRQKIRRSEQTPATMDGSLDHFLKDSSMKRTGTWKSVASHTLLVFASDQIQSRTKVAAFDLDGTIITTASGRVYPQDYNDWKICFPNVIQKLRDLHEQEYKIVFFTNQGGISKGKIRVCEFKKKIEAIAQKLKVPIQVFIAGMDDIYRKPRVGMWQYLAQHENENKEIDVEDSFYCGDAAGRPANCEPNKKKKDFACSDRLFAMNLNLKFFTPEEYFLGWKTAPFNLPEFRPASLDDNGPLLGPPDANLVSKSQEIVIMIGCPGSGKSFFSKTYLVSAGYAYVNRDTLKTWQKCVALAEKSIQEGLSVVIDNTSPDKESRRRYTSLAEQYNIPVRAFWMTTTLEHAKHNNTFRQILTRESHDYIPNHSLITFFKTLAPPTLDEGFREIIRVNVVPRFTDEDEKKLYKMYLLES